MDQKTWIKIQLMREELTLLSVSVCELNAKLEGIEQRSAKVPRSAGVKRMEAVEVRLGALENMVASKNGD